MNRHSFSVAFALLFATFLAAPARADGAGDAKALFEQGSRAYQEGRYEDAVDFFLKAYADDPQPELLYNAAQAYERLGDVRNALRSYRDYLRQHPTDDDRSFVEVRIKNLERRLRDQGVQQVSVLSTPPGAAVLVDGAVVGTTPWTGEARSGRHAVVLKLDGYSNVERELLLTDRSIDLDVALTPIGAPAAAAPPAAAPVASEPRPISEQTPTGLRAIRPWTWAALGVGVAGLGGSLVFEAMRRSAESDAEGSPNQIAYHDAYETMAGRQTAARVLLGVGIAGAAAGGVLLYFDLSRKHGEGSSPRVGTSVGPNRCFVFAGTSF